MLIFHAELILSDNWWYAVTLKVFIHQCGDLRPGIHGPRDDQVEQRGMVYKLKSKHERTGASESVRIKLKLT